MTRRNCNGKNTSPPTVKRAAAYARLSVASSNDQVSSIDTQLDSCAAFIAQQPGWVQVPERYADDGYSGGTLRRPAFERLIEDVKASRIDAVVVHRIDRLSRSLLDFAKLIEFFDSHGVSFCSVTQQFDTGQSLGRLVLNLLMSFAQLEKDLIADRVRDAVRAARRKGRWTGGHAPIGYDLVDRKLVPNEMEAALVRDLFDLYLEQGSAGAVARHLNRAGRLTKRVLLKTGRVREGHLWSRVDVLRVLRNPIVLGLMPAGDEVFAAEHPAIVDRLVFNRAQALLDESSQDQVSHGRNPAYILRGLLRCSCGAAMTPASTRKKNGHVYRYYRCSGRGKLGTDACSAREMPAGAIESFVVEQIRGLAADADLAAEVAERVSERLAGRREALALERKGLPASIGALAADGKKLVDTLVDVEPASRRLVDARLADISRQIAAHETRLTEVERQIATLDEVQVEAEMVARLLADFDAVWSALTVENRGRLVRALVREVIVDEAVGQVTVVLADLAGEPEAAEEVRT